MADWKQTTIPQLAAACVEYGIDVAPRSNKPVFIEAIEDYVQSRQDDGITAGLERIHQAKLDEDERVADERAARRQAKLEKEERDTEEKNRRQQLQLDEDEKRTRERVAEEARLAADEARAITERARAQSDLAQLEEERLHKEKLRDIELRLAADRVNAPQNLHVAPPTPAIVDITKLLHKYTDSENIEVYLTAFEKVCKIQDWEEATWSKYLPPLLSGRSFSAYSRLSVDDSRIYSKVKEALLQAYQISPEVYRSRLRSIKKDHNETYLELSYRIDESLRRWVASEKACTVEELLALLSKEQFLRALPLDLKLYVADRQPVNATDAAKIADLYTANRSHLRDYQPKSHFSNGKGNSRFPNSPENRRKFTNGISNSPSIPPSLKGSTVSQPAPPPAIISNSAPRFSAEGKQRNRLLCTHCNRTNHTVDTCFLLHPEMMTHHNSRPVRRVQAASSQDVTTPPPQALSRVKAPEIIDVNLPKDYMIEVVINDKIVTCLRDTGAELSLIRPELILPHQMTSSVILCKQPLDAHMKSVPLCELEVIINATSLTATMGIAPYLDVPCIIGNDIASRLTGLRPDVVYQVSTRSKARQQLADLRASRTADLPPPPLSVVEDSRQSPPPVTDITPPPAPAVDTAKVYYPLSSPSSPPVDHPVDFEDEEPLVRPPDAADLVPPQDIEDVDPAVLSALQRRDSSVQHLFELVGKPPNENGVSFILKKQILYREFRSRKNSDSPPVMQIVVPSQYRVRLLQLAHDVRPAAHQGATRMRAALTRLFYWPKLQDDVANWSASCDACQRAGKNGSPPPAPLMTVPIVGEIFQKIIIDCIGPFKETASGNKYALTVVDAASHFPECIPLPNIQAETIADALFQVFAHLGYPAEIQHDQALNFCNQLMAELWKKTGVRQIRSSPYHPATNSLNERYNRTIKEAMRILVEMYREDWDRQIPHLLFALRSAPCRTLGFSPFEILYGRHVRGPLDLVRETWEQPTEHGRKTHVIAYIQDLQDRLRNILQIAQTSAEEQQLIQKRYFDRKAKLRSFEPGQQVLLLLPTKDRLQCAWKGPFTVLKRTNAVDYIVDRTTRSCDHRTYHINMMKAYVSRAAHLVCYLNVPPEDASEILELPERSVSEDQAILLQKIQDSHLSTQQQATLKSLLDLYSATFSSLPGRTHLMEHSIELQDFTPTYQSAYRTNPHTQALIKKELDDLLKLGIIRRSNSNYSSPIVLVMREGKSPRAVVDYRQLNSKTVKDLYPMKNSESLIDTIGKAKFITVLDLSRGFNQIPLQEDSIKLSAFATPFGQFEYTRMSFGLTGSPARFQRLMDLVLEGAETYAQSYIDDVAVYSSTWDEHLVHLEDVLHRIQQANLTIRPDKTQLCKGKVTYLSYRIGSGTIKPEDAKVKVLLQYPLPKTKKDIRVYLGFTNYYKRYIQAYADLVAPLTDMLRKTSPDRVIWTPQADSSFSKLNRLLASSPVVNAPDFTRPFSIITDASDRAISAILVQTDAEDNEHPVAYLSRKLTPTEQNYSTIERELLAIIYGVSKYKHYVFGSPFTIITDHKPLQYLSRMSEHNSRLLRYSLILSQYSISIQHRSGSKLQNADSLSRIEVDLNSSEDR